MSRHITAEIKGDVLLLAVDGPITPMVVYKSFLDIKPTVIQMHRRGTLWGTVLRLDNDATFFPESIEMLFDCLEVNSPIFKNRACLALIMQKDTYMSKEMITKFVNLYSHRLEVLLDTFDNLAEGVEWVEEKIDFLTKLKTLDNT